MILVHKYHTCSHQEQGEELFSLVSNGRARKNGFNLEQKGFSANSRGEKQLRKKDHLGLVAISRKEERGHWLGIFEPNFLLICRSRKQNVDFLCPAPELTLARWVPSNRLSQSSTLPGLSGSGTR